MSRFFLVAQTGTGSSNSLPSANESLRTDNPATALDASPLTRILAARSRSGAVGGWLDETRHLDEARHHVQWYRS